MTENPGTPPAIDAGTPVRLALVRHGQTDWNAAGRLQGSSDVPLNDTGRGQAHASAARFDRTQWGAVVASPLGRASETASIIAGSLDITDGGRFTELVERHYGHAEGLTNDEAAERWPDGEFPELEGRDSVAARGLAGIARIVAEHPDTPVIVVAHGTLIREILRRLSPHPVPPIANAATSLIERTDDGWRVLTVNDEAVVPTTDRA